MEYKIIKEIAKIIASYWYSHYLKAPNGNMSNQYSLRFVFSLFFWQIFDLQLLIKVYINRYISVLLWLEYFLYKSSTPRSFPHVLDVLNQVYDQWNSPTSHCFDISPQKSI